MAIASVAYTGPAGTAIALTMSDGTVWLDDAIRPPDTDLRQALADWLAAGGQIAQAAPPDLSALKAALCAQIDAAADVERGRYITSGSGQAMTYQAKAAEALALAADPAPDHAAYPLLSAEVGITAPDLTGVGAVVRGAYAAWQVSGAAIERARLAGKAAVMAADDEAAARAAAAVEWPAPPA